MNEKPLSQNLADTPSSYPRAIERRYASRLRGRALRLRVFTRAGLRENLAASGIRLDAAEPISASMLPAALSTAVLEVAERWRRENEPSRKNLERLAAQIGGRVEREIRKQLGDEWLGQFPTVRALAGTDDPTAERWIRDNARLISSIDDRFFLEVSDLIKEAQLAGETIDSLAPILQSRYNVSRSRANLIARTEIAKLNSQLTEARQLSVGIDRYQWATSRDERVRDSHRAHEGDVFSWSSPPPDTGHPGRDFQCRCVARPVLPEWARGKNSARDDDPPTPRDLFLSTQSSTLTV